MENVSWDFTVDWRKLRLLDELDRRGTITATAEVLQLTPSAVSQQLAGLARDIGVPLLERRGRNVALTGQARLLLAHAQEMRELAERTRAALDSWSEGTAGYVRVASLTTGITALVAPALARLRQQRPGLTLRIINREPIESLELLDAGEADIIVTVDYPGAPSRQDSRYRRVDLTDDIMDAVLPADHPLAGQPSVDLTDLATEAWVGNSPSEPCMHIVNGLCAAAGFTPDIRHLTQEWDAVAALVAAGAGIALIPRSAQPLRSPGLVVLPVAGAPATRTLFALLRAGTEADPAIATVLETLVALAGAEGSPPRS
ncbi:MAG: LysR family transcriptional regulator [Streptosporangiales bacterium]|nr:LysR family transcriptional regulator [Streptosporangiales bacterium]